MPRCGFSFWNSGLPSRSSMSFLPTRCFSLRPACRPSLPPRNRRCLAHDPRQLLLEVAHTGLAAVGLDHVLERRVVDRSCSGAQTVALELLGPQVVARDGELFLGHVARQARIVSMRSSSGRGSYRAGWRCTRTAPWTDPRADPGSDRGNRCSAPDPAPRGAPRPDRRGRTHRSCRSRRA
jgi:hypothetical protein